MHSRINRPKISLFLIFERSNIFRKRRQVYHLRALLMIRVNQWESSQLTPEYKIVWCMSFASRSKIRVFRFWENFGHKQKLNFRQNQNFGKKIKIGQKYYFVIDNITFGQKKNLGQNINFRQTEILEKKYKFWEKKQKFWAKRKKMWKNVNFDRDHKFFTKSKSYQKIEIFVNPKHL